MNEVGFLRPEIIFRTGDFRNFRSRRFLSECVSSLVLPDRRISLIGSGRQRPLLLLLLLLALRGLSSIILRTSISATAAAAAIYGGRCPLPALSLSLSFRFAGVRVPARALEARHLVSTEPPRQAPRFRRLGCARSLGRLFLDGRRSSLSGGLAGGAATAGSPARTVGSGAGCGRTGSCGASTGAPSPSDGVARRTSRLTTLRVTV